MLTILALTCLGMTGACSDCVAGGGENPPAPAAAPGRPGIIRSARSGPWSAPETWQDRQLPGPGASVLVRAGHTVVYDVHADAVVRSVHVAGTLRFARDRSTLLCVGLLKIQPGEDCGE